MISNFNIKNFKSVIDLDLPLGRFNVIIGANGCGKTTILEAIALVSSAIQGKLDEEFWDNRGIRVVEPEMMFPAFEGITEDPTIKISFKNENIECRYWIYNTDGTWCAERNSSKYFIEGNKKIGNPNQIDEIMGFTNPASKELPDLYNFIIYSLEESVLRYSMSNNGLRPLGRKGERLFSYLKDLSKKENGLAILEEIKENLTILDWFDDMEVPKDLLSMDFELRLKDQYMRETISAFDQRSANEGFLYLLFYLTLVISDDTPKFFAIENIDSAFNPKLCRKIAGVLSGLAKKHDKQIIVTTHNPSFLDGMNLNDEDQRLLVASRNDDGYTRVKRIVQKPQHTEGQQTKKLSELWMGGYLGGVPNNF